MKYKIVYKNRKGMSMTDFGMLLYRIILLTVAIFVFVNFTKVLLTPFPEINEAKSEILMGRILYSDAIHYVDNSRIYTDIIDVDKLRNAPNDYFENNFYNSYRDNLFSFKLTLLYKNTTSLNFYSNEVFFDTLNPLRTKKGKGAATSSMKMFRTKCKDNDILVPCTAVIDLLITNS